MLGLKFGEIAPAENTNPLRLSLALGAGRDLAQVDVPALQKTLRADGVYLEDVPRDET